MDNTVAELWLFLYWYVATYVMTEMNGTPMHTQAARISQAHRKQIYTGKAISLHQKFLLTLPKSNSTKQLEYSSV